MFELSDLADSCRVLNGSVSNLMSSPAPVTRWSRRSLTASHWTLRWRSFPQTGQCGRALTGCQLGYLSLRGQFSRTPLGLALSALLTLITLIGGSVTRKWSGVTAG